MEEEINESKSDEIKEEGKAPLITTSCSFTKEGYYAMSWNQSLRTYIPFVIILEVLFIGWALYVFLRQGNTVVGIIMVAMACAYPLVLWGLTILGMHRAYSMNQKLFENAHYDYEFYDDKVAVHFASAAGKSDTELIYEKIYRVTVVKDYIFIYIQKNQAYILIKKEMSSPEKVTAFLEEKAHRYNIPFRK